MILAIDPSGNFNEGAGVTGWSLLREDMNRIIKFGIIDASTASTDIEHWGRHLDLIKNLNEQYGGITVVMEDYLLYAAQANTQINSRMETVKLIGIIQYYCAGQDIPCKLQTAASVKRRWPNYLLAEKGYIKRTENTRVVRGVEQVYELVSVNGFTVADHVVDSIRHAVHYATFHAGKEK